jgi:hypothetical protein
MNRIYNLIFLSIKLNSQKHIQMFNIAKEIMKNEPIELALWSHNTIMLND